MIITAEEWNIGCAFRYEATIGCGNRGSINLKWTIPSLPKTPLKYRYSPSTGGWVDATDYTAPEYRDAKLKNSDAGWVDGNGSENYKGFDAMRNFRVITCGSIKDGFLRIGTIIHRLWPINDASAASDVMNNSQSFYMGWSSQYDVNALNDLPLRVEVFSDDPSSNSELMEFLDVTRFK